jgi:hypothetical protein
VTVKARVEVEEQGRLRGNVDVEAWRKRWRTTWRNIPFESPYATAKLG